MWDLCDTQGHSPHRYNSTENIQVPGYLWKIQSCGSQKQSSRLLFLQTLWGDYFLKIKSPPVSSSSWPGFRGIQSNFEMSRPGLNFNQTQTWTLAPKQMQVVYYHFAKIVVLGSDRSSSTAYVCVSVCMEQTCLEQLIFIFLGQRAIKEKSSTKRALREY